MKEAKKEQVPSLLHPNGHSRWRSLRKDFGVSPPMPRQLAAAGALGAGCWACGRHTGRRREIRSCLPTAPVWCCSPGAPPGLCGAGYSGSALPPPAASATWSRKAGRCQQRPIPAFTDELRSAQQGPESSAWDVHRPFVQRLHTVHTACPPVPRTPSVIRSIVSLCRTAASRGPRVTW